MQLTKGRPNRAVLLGVLGVAVIAVLAFVGLRSEKAPAGGPPAPELPRQALIGAPLTISNFVAGARGRPTLVLFWASWCGPCKSEAGDIERFSQTSQGRGRIVGVNWSDALSSARSFIATYHWSFPNARDGNGTVGNEYRLTGLPTTFVVNGKGHVISTLRGPQTEKALKSALSAAEAG